MKKQIALLTISSIIITLTLPTFADSNQPNDLSSVYEINRIEPYIGLNFVYNNMKFHDTTGDYLSNISGYNVETSEIFNVNHLGVNLNIGAQINKYFAVESYFQQTFSNKKVKIIEYKIDSFTNQHIGLETKNFKTLSFGIDLIGSIPVNTTNFSLICSLGGGYYEANYKFTAEAYEFYGDWIGSADYSQKNGSETENNLGLRIGIGTQYKLSERWAIRLLARYIKIFSNKEEDDLSGILDMSVGLKYTF